MTRKVTNRPRTILAVWNAAVWSQGDAASSPTALLRKQATHLQGGDVLVLSLELRGLRSAANPRTHSHLRGPVQPISSCNRRSGHWSAVLCYRPRVTGFPWGCSARPTLACCPPVAGVTGASLSTLRHCQMAHGVSVWDWLPYSVLMWLQAPFKDSETPDTWGCRDTWRECPPSQSPMWSKYSGLF